MSNITLQAKKSTLESDGRRTVEEIHSTGNAAHVTSVSAALTQGILDSDGNPKTVATTALPRYANDVNAPNTAASADAAETTAVIAGDVVERSWVETDVDGAVIECHGGTGFTGIYVTLAATDIGTTTAATRLTGVSDNADRNRVWCPAGERTLIPFAGLQYIFMVAMDVDGTEQNHVNIIPV